MLLTGLVIAQLALDVVLVLLVVWGVTRKRAAPLRMPDVPPAWYGDLVALAQELVAVTEPVLDALEGQRRQPPPEARDTPPARDGRREAFALLRAGVASEEVARRSGLLPGEVRLMRNLVSAESGLTGVRREA